MVFLNDTWASAGFDWTKKLPANSPTPRFLITMAYDEARQEILMFGGLGGPNGNLTFNDTWAWNGVNWALKSPTHQPSPRGGYAMAYDEARQQIVLFGGASLYDTWTWDGTDWTQQAPATVPRARTYAAMAFDQARQQIVMFGGNCPNSSCQLNDTWAWNGTNWTQQTTFSQPSPRSQAAMAYDTGRQEIVLFGGGGGTPGSETWTWNGTNWNQKNPVHHPASLRVHAMAYDPVRSQIVLTGGYLDANNTVTNDTWIWDGVDWFHLSP